MGTNFGSQGRLPNLTLYLHETKMGQLDTRNIYLSKSFVANLGLTLLTQRSRTMKGLFTVLEPIFITFR
jgi:hypothetical protein